MADNKDKKVLNVPALRFPEFCGEWKEVKLSKVIKVQGGYAFKSELFQQSGVPIIRISNLPQNELFVNLNDCVYYSEGNYHNFEVHKGDLLIAMSGATTGKTAIYNNNSIAYLNQRVGCFKVKSDLFYSFLYALVETKSFKNQLNKKLIAGAQPNISSFDIESIKVTIPGLIEQQKIAKLIGLLNERIDTQNKIIEKLETLIKGIVEKTFVSSQYVTLQHYSPIITSGKDQNSGGNYPLYGSTGVIGSVLNPSYNKPIVLIARVGSIGNVQYVTAPCGISDNTLIIDAGEDNRFIYYYLNGYNFSHIISGTTQPLITASSVKKIEIPVIEKHRRKKIVSTLYAIEQKLRNEKYIAYLLSRQKYFLLSQMFI